MKPSRYETTVAQAVTGSTVSSSGRLTAYRTAIVKDLVIEESALAYVQPQDRAAVEAAKASLIADFSTRFREDLAKRRYFESFTAETAPNAVIIEAKALVLDPGAKTGAFTGTPTRIDIMVSITDATTGAIVASYVTPTQFLPKTNLPVVNRLQSYFPAASGKVADGMAKIR